MFFAPKEIKKETGESLVYNSHRTMVSKEFTFDAAHHLFNYEGKCKSLHGHTYHLQIAVSGYLDERGMTYDFGDPSGPFAKGRPKKGNAGLCAVKNILYE